MFKTINMFPPCIYPLLPIFLILIVTLSRAFEIGDAQNEQQVSEFGNDREKPSFQKCFSLSVRGYITLMLRKAKMTNTGKGEFAL